VAEIDFITALGRLLRDGTLRDAFAASPEAVATQINLRQSDCPAFLQLVPEDLEFQARILLRKRLEQVRPLLPETVWRLGEHCWPQFLAYALTNWPDDSRAALQDAFQFCQCLRQPHPQWVCPSEWNRLRFALSGKHLSFQVLGRQSIRGKWRPQLQIFFRGRTPRWREWVFHLGL
jgi:hypothetical protein